MAPVFTNAGPVYQTPVIAYQPGIGVVQTRALPTEKTYRTGGSNAEGNIAVGNDNTVFSYSPISGLTATYDGGLTWQSVEPPAGCAGPGYDHTVFYAAGRLFLTGSSTPKVNISDTQGQTWSATCGQQAPGAEVSWNADRANIFAGPSSVRAAKQPSAGYPDMVYYCGQSVRGNDEPGTFFTLCEHSYDGGVTWTNSNNPVFTQPMNGCDALANGGRWTPDISVPSVGPDGTVYVPKQFCGHPYVAMSTDNGDTWTQVQVSDNVAISGQYGGYELGSAADTHGDVFVTWIGADGKPYLSVSKNHGHSFAPPIMFAAPGVNTAFWPWLSIDSQGRLDIEYAGTSGTGNTDPSEQWFEYLAEIPFPTSGAHPLIYTATTTPTADPWLIGAGGPDRAPLNCGCDYTGVATSPSGNTWARTTDDGPGNLGELASVLSAPPECPQPNQKSCIVG